MFPDIANVIRIREALWRHAAIGNASVMVGAGFSRNAEPVSATARKMPDWAQMAQALCEPLYPDNDGRRHAALEEAKGTSGFLRLAQEYQAAFGVSDLNHRIRGLVPDTDYRPGDLHKRLLRLPWAEVFSTNWDTLLERARDDVLERSYDTVRTVGEIAFTSRPRIVKLHGTLPGHDPFVFTEEDYRTYPRLFSPFVNMVQQAMMETIFCLVGFSGEDPNFLHWSGWVRDNLGPSAPKIYLVGWLELSIHRRRMLEARNVMPIDLAALPQAATWPNHKRHRYATEWFLAALERGEPQSVANWPSRPNEPPPPPSYLGDLPPQRVERPVDEPHDLNRHNEGADRDAGLREVVAAWRHNRLLYPGWLVPPPRIREVLLRTVSEWGQAFKEIGQLRPWERVLGLGELAWRMQYSLFPLFSDHETDAVTALRSIDLVTQRIDGEPLPPDFSWTDILFAAELLAKSLAQNGRHELSLAKFTAATEMLDRLAEHHAEAANTAAFERCLWDTGVGDLGSLVERLEAWSPEESANIWNVRKAGLLAEVDEYHRSSALLERALARTRRDRRRDIDDLPALSLEGWALLLALPFVTRFGPQEQTPRAQGPEPFQRWRDLSVVNCDALSEWQMLKRAAENGSLDRPTIERKKGFDLGQVNHTHNLSSWPTDAVLAGYRMVMIADVTGLPISARHVDVLGGGLTAATRVLADREPALACQLAIRIGRDEAIDVAFSRTRVARLLPGVVQTLKAGLLNRLAFGRIGLNGDRERSGSRLVGSPVEILSRLVVRLPTEDLRGMFDMALEYYGAVDLRTHILDVGDEIRHLMSRTLEAMSGDQIDDVLPLLFGSLPPLATFRGSDWDIRFEPTRDLPTNYSPSDMNASDRAIIWDGVISKLLGDAPSAEPLQRTSAIFRLYHLNKWHLLRPGEIEAFGQALWSPGRRDGFGMPDHTGLIPWTLLQMPEMEKGQAETALYAYMAAQSRRVDDNLYARVHAVGDVLRGFGHLDREVVLSEDGYHALRDLVLAWIASRARIASSANDFFGSHDSHEGVAVEGIATLLRYVSLDDADFDRLILKIDDMDEGRDGRHMAAPLYPVVARLRPNLTGVFLDRLRRALLSDDEEKARQAVVGASRWLQAFQSDPHWEGPDLDDVVREIGIAIASRRLAILDNALGFARWLFESGPERYRELIAADCEHGLAALRSEANYDRTPALPDLPQKRALAIALATRMSDAGFGDGVGVSGWLEDAATDPLPEVRNARSRKQSDGGEGVG
jgi:hypothetical protein